MREIKSELFLQTCEKEKEKELSFAFNSFKVEMLLIYFKDLSETNTLHDQRIKLVLRIPFRLVFGKVEIVVVNREHVNKVVIQVRVRLRHQTVHQMIRLCCLRAEL